MIIDEVRAELPRLRAEAESLMTLTAAVARPTGAVTVDEETGLESPAMTDVYVGACDLLMPGSQARSVEVAGEVLAILSPVLKLPLSAPRLARGDVVLVDERRYVVRVDITRAHPVTQRYQLDD